MCIHDIRPITLNFQIRFQEKTRCRCVQRWNTCYSVPGTYKCNQKYTCSFLLYISSQGCTVLEYQIATRLLGVQVLDGIGTVVIMIKLPPFDITKLLTIVMLQPQGKRVSW
jgi:hypothetical protein